MTPGARVAAAIDVLDQILAGAPAEQALTNWARRSRFAGSSDRAAVRDHVFDALRRRRSAAWRGGGETARAILIGLCRDQGLPLEDLFTGQGHAPQPLSAGERADPGPAPASVSADLPDWVAAMLRNDLGAEFDPVAAALRERAPLYVRVNSAKTKPEAAIAALGSDGIAAERHHLSRNGLLVTAGGRRLRGSTAYQRGLVEIQDAASQAIVDALCPARRVLDFCAGGGGKSLAFAAEGAEVTAHDADPRRMTDLPHRAARAGTPISLTQDQTVIDASDPFDLVLCDAPCSGSGAWRRQPEGRWRLTPDRLADRCAEQASILGAAQRYVAPGGRLAYVTCSLFAAENETQAERFCAAHPDWTQSVSRRFLPTQGGDGFYLAVFHRA